MHLHRSHDVDQLAEALGDLLANEPLGWNQQDVVAVQGRGMERWLLMKLAERFGGVLGLEHLFPRGLIERVLAAVVGDDAGSLVRWGDAALTWAVLAVLPEALLDAEFEPLRRYLGEEGAPGAVSARRLSLARELATLIDRYATYRPELTLSFLGGSREGAEDAWQPALVRAVAQRVGVPCHAAVVGRAIERLLSDEPIAGLPTRVVLFGVTTLPPMYLRLLDALSHRIEVHLFWLVPTPHYFGDQRTMRQVARARMRGEQVEGEAIGHPLLASLGRSSRDFQWVVYGECERLHEGDDRFDAAPDPSTVLGRLKHDLHHMSPTGGSGGPPPVPFPEGDRSFVVHSCHGKLRQVEALRDELLRAFVELPDLEPRDVAVLCPDVDAYAPLVRAVFGEGDDSTTAAGRRLGFPAIPVRVADSAPRHEASAVDGFLAVLGLAGGRLAAPDVADVLLRPAVARRFGLASAEPTTVIRLVRETGMRWGIDGAHRTRFEQPEDEAFTLRRGLARLLLGQAMRGDEARAYREVLPYDDAADRELVAGLVEALETFFAFAEALREPRRPADLVAFVQRWFRALVDPSADEVSATMAIEAAVAAEAEHAAALGFDAPLDAEAQRALLEHALALPSGPSRLLGGAVSVASLVPMRAIPFRVVALLGLDEATFPRRTIGRGFDLTERRPLPGDRRLEDDDRAAMLEAIVSAGERLVLVYQGRDPHSNETLPTSAPIAELIDCVVDAYAPRDVETGLVPESARKAVLSRILVEHSLHPFGRAELRAGSPFSFDARHLAQAEALAARKRGEQKPWVDATLPLGATDEQGRLLVRTADLIRFFDDPIAAFLEKRARIELDPDREELQDREPYELDALESASLTYDVLRMSRDGIAPEVQRDRLRIAGRLPVGRTGELAYIEARRKVDSLLSVAAPVLASPKLPPVSVDATLRDVPVGGSLVSVRLVGTLDDRHALARLRFRPGKLDTRHRLRQFVEQSIAEAAADVDEPTHLYALGEDGEVVASRYRGVPDPHRYLTTLLSVHLEGLRSPLPFSLGASDAFLHGERIALKKGASPDEARRAGIQRARSWLGVEGRKFAAADRLDLRRLFGSPPTPRMFDDDFGLEGSLHFVDVVERVVRPLIEADGTAIAPLDPEVA